MKPPLPAATASAALLLLAGCWGPEGGPVSDAHRTAPSPSTAAAATATLGADGVQRVRVAMTDDLRFVPAHVRAHPGVIEFTVVNQGVTPHDVTVHIGGATPGPGNVNGGRSATFRFTVTRPGDYPFPCTYHAASGMTGVLEVQAG
jgi:plastocyanin